MLENHHNTVVQVLRELAYSNFLRLKVSRLSPWNVGCLWGTEVPKKTEKDAKFQNGELGHLIPLQFCHVQHTLIIWSVKCKVITQPTTCLPSDAGDLRLMEVVGVKSKPDYNGEELKILFLVGIWQQFSMHWWSQGKIVRVLKFHPEACPFLDWPDSMFALGEGQRWFW